MFESDMSIFELDAPKRSLFFSNILRFKQKRIREKKRRDVLSRFMVRSPNVLSKLCHRIPRSRRCRSTISVLRAGGEEDK
jgi:hypothetical protein